VDQLVRLLGEEAGLEKRVHPHLLRQSFATWALTRGLNPIQLAQIMGHSSLAMIQSVYAHLTPQDAYAALEQIVRSDA
jgi:integrase/recombinase XerD